MALKIVNHYRSYYGTNTLPELVFLTK